jgi:hypothetical protein
MAEESEAAFSLMCSGCYTPCTGADAHVVPRWRADRRTILTTYRCGGCWLAALADLRSVVSAGEPDVSGSFCDFLARHGYGQDAAAIRAAPPEQQRAYLLAVVDAVERGQVTFQP